MKLYLVALCLILSTVSGFRTAQKLSGEGSRHDTVFQTEMGHPGASNCTTNWFDQWTDHFSFNQPAGTAGLKWNQRYLTYDKYYKAGGPIFFYCGNEGPIEAFANIAGLMWQNAAEFNAAIIFAEHRFFGESQPCDKSDKNGGCLQQLNTMQALADYAVLLTNLTGPAGQYHDSEGIITFGGSYGGMLSAWFRMKYPNLITGSIASSAPIRMVSDSYDTSSYWKVITRDATAEGGAAATCASNVYKALQAAFKLLSGPAGDAGAKVLSNSFKTCKTLPAGQEGVNQLGYFVQSAFDVMGMGDYPFSLDFMFGTPTHPAPAWPMRVACESLTGNFSTETALLEGLYNAISVFYNVTKDVKCYDTTVNPTTGGMWDFMVCSERVINELPYFAAKGWPNDMFWPQKEWTHEDYSDYCGKAYGVSPRFGWLNTTYGAGNLEGASKIVFANGLLDPWHSGGILWNVSETVRSYIIPFGAHHLDLLFTSPSDPPGVQWVREREKAHIFEWLAELKEKKRATK